MSLYEADYSAVKGRGGNASAYDYVLLMKPRVMSLVVFTAYVGLALAPVSLHPVLAAAAILCIAVGAGAAGALNMWYDSDIDAVMRRTAKRPIPSGRVSRDDAFNFGLVLSVGSVMTLGLALNWVAAALLAATIAFYVVVYTMWLKRRTAQNIVIGGAAGAFPPVVAWAAATGGLSYEPLILFLIIFLWTPPHFWALALLRSEDYRQAKVPMLPVTAGEKETRRQIVLYSLLLAPSALLPSLLGFASPFHGIAAAVLGVLFIGTAIGRLKRLFSFSITYLFLIFALLLV